MHGNVHEWVEDWFGSGYYAESPAIDPSGPPIGTFRVLRGGSWSGFSRFGRASYRTGLNPGNVNVLYGLGFRAARTP
ncbi:MAG: formylglycine-generating enzyme family protein, partial [Phycisphaerales bacterium]